MPRENLLCYIWIIALSRRVTCQPFDRVVAENSSNLLSRTNNSQPSMGQGFFVYCFPSLCRHGKRSYSFPGGTHGMQKRKDLIDKDFVYLNKVGLYLGTGMVNLQVIGTCEKEAVWTLSSFKNTGKCKFYRKTGLDSPSMKIRIKQNSPYSKHIHNFPERSRFV